MNDAPSRRTLLAGLAALGAVGCLPSAGDLGEPHPGCVTDPVRAMRAARELGQALREAGLVTDADAELLAPVLAEGATDPRAIRELARLHTDDLVADATVVFDRWTLSRTEARFYAYISLS